MINNADVRHDGHGFRLYRTENKKFVLELDYDGAWWLMECLNVADRDDQVTRAVVDFVCTFIPGDDK